MRSILAALILCALAIISIAIGAPMHSGDEIIIFGGTSSASGSQVGACANQLVLDYSNSCALIAQGWGQ